MNKNIIDFFKSFYYVYHKTISLCQRTICRFAKYNIPLGWNEFEDFLNGIIAKFNELEHEVYNLDITEDNLDYYWDRTLKIFYEVENILLKVDIKIDGVYLNESVFTLIDDEINLTKLVN